MMQAIRVLPEFINRCQNHRIPGPRVQKHYFHHAFDVEKSEAWQQLGAHIEAILGAPSVLEAALLGEVPKGLHERGATDAAARDDVIEPTFRAELLEASVER